MTQSFIHIRLHSEFSLVDGIVRLKPLMNKLVENEMPAVALTDLNNLFALVKFQKAAFAAGIKPIFGADIKIRSEIDDSIYELCLLVQNQQGYKNLTELISKIYQEGQSLGQACAKEAWLEGFSDGLICLSGGVRGGVGHALFKDGHDAALAYSKKFKDIFQNRFYLEIQRTGREKEGFYVEAAVNIAGELDLPLVATNDVRFIEASEFEAHETRVCINDGRTLDDPRRERKYSDQQYLRSAAEMHELFSDLPEALQNTVEIARRCNFFAPLGKSYLPNYPIPENQTIEEFFKEISLQGLQKRFQELKAIDQLFGTEQEYLDRLDFELGIINEMGFPGYFLIVMDFIKWAKENGVPVGPGRGSGAGSLVAYALEITDLDPLRYDLLFERFLNPERVSMPDFDIDFCMDGRDRVIEYVAQTYGRDAVSQIITYGTMAAKAVVRDVARVQGKPYGLADKLSKLIPMDVGITLHKAMEQEAELREFVAADEEADEIMSMAFQLEGITRNVGKHAGGVVISPSKLTDFTPIYCDESGGGLVTQYDKDDVEQVGLVKFDFLGLRTLTIIDWAIKAINQDRKKKGEEPLKIENIPLDDEASFEYLRTAETTAVFQLESRGMKDLISRLQPSNFEDIIALVALFRPGPLQSGMVDDFIARKHGRAKVTYPHPDLEPVLKNTYGVIVYQEQVMQIAQVLANYTLGGADMLRRAMGKKKPEEMAKQRELFNEGARNNNIEEKVATPIFDLMEKFAEYGFNKSHSAAYALVSYHTLWLKTHYPAYLMASVLSADLDNTDKIVTLIEECRKMNLEIILPSVNGSRYKFYAQNENSVVYGLGAIKGVGEGPIESIIEERAANGEFKDLFEFCRRLSGTRVNRKVIEALIRSGSMDVFQKDRAVLLASLDSALQAADQHAQNQSSGMEDMFGLAESESPATNYVETKPFRQRERLQGEKETLGLYLTGHPFDQYEKELRQFVPKRIAKLSANEKLETICGVVVSARSMYGRRGKMIFAQVDDRSASLEVTFFSETAEQLGDLVVKDAVLILEGKVSHDDYTGGLKMLVENAQSLNDAREHFASDIRICLQGEEQFLSSKDELKQLLMQHGAKGMGFKSDEGCPLVLEYQNHEASACIQLSSAWNVKPEDTLLEGLMDMFGQQAVKLNYSRSE
jgi:DNA polymerase-3 subunit alpha